MKPNTIIPLFVLTLLLASCSSVRESLIDQETGKPVAGYCRDCPLQIGKTTKSTLSPEQVASYQSEGLNLMFLPGSKKNPADSILQGVSTMTKRYQTLKGLKVGDSTKKAQAAYGVPQSKLIGNEAPNNGVWMAMFGLFYHGISFITAEKDSEEIVGMSIQKGNSKQYTTIKPF